MATEQPKITEMQVIRTYSIYSVTGGQTGIVIVLKPY